MGYEEFKVATSQNSVVCNLENETIDLGVEYKVALIVNTASRCGFTRQYADLQKLYEQFKDQGLVIFAYPSNNFGEQEPGSYQEIKDFCKTNFGITFPIMPKSEVVGPGANTLYCRLSALTGQSPKWNFHKYVITNKLSRIYSLDHFTEIDDEFIQKIKKLLSD